MFGSHCNKTHSQTQETIALSSGESEFYWTVNAAAIGLGVKGLMEDLGPEVEGQVNTDSSAAQSMTARKGAGRARHTEVRELWVQDRVAKGELKIVKVKGDEKWFGEARGQAEDGAVRDGMRPCPKVWQT